MLDDRQRRVLTIGLTESPREAVFSTIVAARLTTDGEHIVVLDAAPPFVRVFRRDGRLRAAFLGAGGGPAEARIPSALATTDSTVFVGAGERRYWAFDLDGKLLDGASLDLLPLAAASDSGGEWIVYGPRTVADGVRATGATYWLHRFRRGGNTESVVAEAAPDRPIAIGIGYGMVADASGIVVRHDFGALPSIVSWRVDGSAPSITPIAGMQARQPAAVGSERDERRAFRVEAGSRIQLGLASTAAGLVTADFIAGVPGGAGDRTEFRRIGDGRVVTVAGMHRVYDSRPGIGVLLGSQDPAPHIFLLPEADFLALFGD